MKLFDFIRNINNKSGLISKKQFDLLDANYNTYTIEKMYTFTRFVFIIDELNNLGDESIEINKYLHYLWLYTHIPKNKEYIKIPKHNKKMLEVLDKYKMGLKHYDMLVFVNGKTTIDKSIEEDNVKRKKK